MGNVAGLAGASTLPCLSCLCTFQEDDVDMGAASPASPEPGAGGGGLKLVAKTMPKAKETLRAREDVPGSVAYPDPKCGEVILAADSC